MFSLNLIKTFIATAQFIENVGGRGKKIPKSLEMPGGNNEINTEEGYSIRSLVWTLPEVNVVSWGRKKEKKKKIRRVGLF